MAPGAGGRGRAPQGSFMPTEDTQEVWPPPPSPGGEPQAGPVPEPPAGGRSRRVLGWVGPALFGLAGGIAGSIYVPLLLLTLVHDSKHPGTLAWALLGWFLAGLAGAGVGSVLGVGVWFGGKALVGRWGRVRSG